MNNFSVQQLVSDELKKDQVQKEIKSWHPSKLGSCLTGAYLERLGKIADAPFDDRTLRVFSVGHMMEDWLVNLISKQSTSVERQTRVLLPEYDVTGYADFVIGTPEGKLLYEVKSKHSQSFWWMDKKKQGAQQSHRMQTWIYLKALNLPEGRIIYLSKDDLAILEYPIFLDDKELEKQVLDELNILNRAWKEKVAPPLPPDDDWRAKYCSFHKQCKQQTNYLKV